MKKLPVLEELSIYVTHISKEAIESVGLYCPMLKTLKLNNNPLRSREFSRFPNERAIAIGENLGGLRHLELIGDKMTNVGLEVILDGCRHLESLDLRACSYIDLSACSYIDVEGEPIWRKCLEKIKCVKRPKDSLNLCIYKKFLYYYDGCIKSYDM